MAHRQPGPGRPTSNLISEAQQRSLAALREIIAKKGFAPTMAELGEFLSISAASAHQLVGQLERKGYITRDSGKARSITVSREPMQMLDALVSIPVLGLVKAGPAMLAEENLMGHVMVSQKLIGRGKCFALQISGDSMINANINDGDVVIVRQQPIAENGEIVVALIEDEATVKRLFVSEDLIELRAENKRYKPIVVAPDCELRILGKVVGVTQYSRGE